MSAQAAEPAGAPAEPEKRLRLVRVKRKRGSEAPEDLVVEAPGKRANTSLASAMEGLGLGAQQQQQQAEQAEQQDGAADAQGTAAAGAEPAVRRQRYRKVSTLSAAQLSAMDSAQLSSLLAAGVAAQQQRRAAVKGGGGGGAAAAAAAQDRAAGALAAGAAARYEQIRRRRGLSLFSITEQAADPLQQLASVVDVVRHEGEGGGSRSKADAGASAAAAAGGARPRPSRAQRAAAQYAEGTLLCNYLPMVREYLAASGRPEAAAALGAQAAAAAGAQQQGQQPGAAAAMEVEEDEEGASEYVYDLYAEVSEDEGGARGSDDEWWELHSSGRAPVVQIVDDDTWLVVEAGDAEDSDADSQDSNAEGFHAHDYPEEPSDWDSSDDGGYDPEGSTFHRQKAAGSDDGGDGGSGSGSDGW